MHGDDEQHAPIGRTQDARVQRIAAPMHDRSDAATGGQCGKNSLLCARIERFIAMKRVWPQRRRRRR